MDLKDFELKIEKDNITIDVLREEKRSLDFFKNSFTLSELLTQVKNKPYRRFYESIGGKDTRDKILEDKMSFIPMAYGFYFYFVTMKRIPTIQEFSNFFISSFCIKDENKMYHFRENCSNKPEHKFKKKFLEAKLCRAYNSYIREIALLYTFYKLQDKYEKYRELNIYYDVHEDILCGVDIVIKNGEKTHGILITQKSKYADNYNSKKRDHRHEYDYDNYIYVKFNEDETIPVGESYIFTEKVAEKILEEIIA